MSEIVEVEMGWGVDHVEMQGQASLEGVYVTQLFCSSANIPRMAQEVHESLLKEYGRRAAQHRAAKRTVAYGVPMSLSDEACSVVLDQCSAFELSVTRQ